MRYKFNYTIHCASNPVEMMSTSGHAPGLYVRRWVERKAVWMLKLETRFGKWWQETNKDLIDWPWKRSNNRQ